ncbi:hypothetical protein K435DRAFT_917088 [Dendrothele bispora CBS 962.96]|uniref:ZZ-type domain-containing protein n=1 Tax=Dendrothele bispora (strain CBS 962.96) TaxID=1314807 RepID=A0A4S8LHC7_DENBC|nr:hypothetical protein K435DRAFT_917088 [Dendrothele bispora CBS 962.96]
MITTAMSLSKNLLDASALEKFTETSKVIMDGFTALGQIHPFIGGEFAVAAFKGVVSMNLTRIENNKKVLVLHATMQETIIVLFQLRDLKDPSVQLPGSNETVEGRLGGIVEKIANDIKKTGSAIDHYVKKGFLAKTIKSSVYETRLAGFASLFVQHKEDLEFALSVNTALGVDNANKQLQDQGLRMANLERTTQEMLKLLQDLSSKREKDVKGFIESHGRDGGVKACIENDRLLEELLEKSGESPESVAGGVQSRNESPLAMAKKALNKELAENVDQALKRNFSTFEKKLDLHMKQLDKIEASVHAEGNRVIDAFNSGPHDRIHDKDLKAIWKDMSWKGSVKARHFVLALHDHFLAERTLVNVPVEELPSSPTTDTPVADSSGRPLSVIINGETTAVTVARQRQDTWALAYINITRVQPILEAIDDDGTGFISIKEVNDFTDSRPEGWTLPVWLAYWSQGWHENMNRYKEKIVIVMQWILIQVEKLKPANRAYADMYINDWAMNRVDALLRSLQEVNSVPDTNDAQLRKFSQEYTEMEEQRLKENLEAFNYEIDEAKTISYITGPGRVERYILPLLYLILKHHLAILKLGERHILDSYEFTSMAQTITSLFAGLDDRIANLIEIFKQTSIDVDQRIKNYAWGLLYFPYSETEWNPSANAILPWGNNPDASLEDFVEDEISKEAERVTVADLRYETNDQTKPGALDYGSSVVWDLEDGSSRPHPFVGAWSGYLGAPDAVSRSERSMILAWIWIDAVDAEGNVVGKCDTANDPFDVTGTITADYHLTLMLKAEETYRRLYGRLDVDTQSVIGEQWDEVEQDDDESSESGSEESEDEGSDAGQNDGRTEDGEQFQSGEPPERDLDNADGTSRVEGDRENADGTFFLCRTPVSVHRFRYTPEQYTAGRALARWKFACQAVLFQVRQRMWSKSYFRDILPERLRLVKLATQRLIDTGEWTPCLPLSEGERDDLGWLLKVTPPTEARFWIDFSSFALDHILYFLGYRCANCDRVITQTRFSCVKCTDENRTNQIDMCIDCVDSEVNARGFNHSPSHPMLRAHHHFMQDGEYSYYSKEGADIGSRVKETFRLKEEIKRGDKQGEPPETVCCVCLVKLDPPCWACADCTPDSYVCNSCADKNQNGHDNGPTPYHEWEHPLIRILDTVVEDPNSNKTDDLSQNLSTLEKTMGERNEHFASRFESLESRLDSFDARFRNLEDLLQRMVDGLVHSKANGIA